MTIWPLLNSNIFSDIATGFTSAGRRSEESHAGNYRDMLIKLHHADESPAAALVIKRASSMKA